MIRTPRLRDIELLPNGCVNQRVVVLQAARDALDGQGCPNGTLQDALRVICPYWEAGLIRREILLSLCDYAFVGEIKDGEVARLFAVVDP